MTNAGQLRMESLAAGPRIMVTTIQDIKDKEANKGSWNKIEPVSKRDVQPA